MFQLPFLTFVLDWLFVAVIVVLLAGAIGFSERRARRLGLVGVE